MLGRGSKSVQGRRKTRRVALVLGAAPVLGGTSVGHGGIETKIKSLQRAGK